MKAQVNPKSTSNQSTKPCTVLQYPSTKDDTFRYRVTKYVFVIVWTDTLLALYVSQREKKSFCEKKYFVVLKDTFRYCFKESRFFIVFKDSFFFFECEITLPTGLCTCVCESLSLSLADCLFSISRTFPLSFSLHLFVQGGEDS